MNRFGGFKDRRSTSTVLPRIFLLLQVIMLLLTSYILYMTLSALGISQNIIVLSLTLTNAYIFTKMFFKCKSISKRNTFYRKNIF